MARKRRRRISYIEEQHRWKLSLLREFVAIYGWKKLNRDTIVKPGVKLYRWVTARRIDYTTDKIASWLVAECEAIPGWSWRVFDDAYKRNRDNLRRFVKKNGWEALTEKPVVEGVRLDKWVAHRRDEWRSKRLDKWLVRALEAIPGWTWDPRRASYERNLSELREHLELRSWESIRANTISRRGANLGFWITNVRAMHRRGDLEPWVVAELELIPGWSWEPRHARQQQNIARLAEYVAAHGWDAVSDALVVDEVKLGDWISNCRMRYHEGTLAPETVAGLAAIAGWAWAGRKTWYQPKDDAGRFVDIPASERVRQRDAKSARRREKSNA